MTSGLFSYEVVLVLQTLVQVLISVYAGTMDFDKATHMRRAEYLCVCRMKDLFAPLAWKSICLHPLYSPMNFWSLTFKHLWRWFCSYICLLIMLLSCLRSKMSGYFWNWRFCEALAKVLLTSLYSYIHPNIRGEPGWFLSSTLMLLISNTFFEKGIRPEFLPTAVLQRKWQKLVFRYYMFLITTQGNQNKTILIFFLIFYILYGNWWFKILHQGFFFTEVLSVCFDCIYLGS